MLLGFVVNMTVLARSSSYSSGISLSSYNQCICKVDRVEVENTSKSWTIEIVLVST